MTHNDIPRECKSVVYMRNGLWQMRAPERRKPRYHLAESLTAGWAIKQNRKRRRA